MDECSSPPSISWRRRRVWLAATQASPMTPRQVGPAAPLPFSPLGPGARAESSLTRPLETACVNGKAGVDSNANDPPTCWTFIAIPPLTAEKSRNETQLRKALPADHPAPHRNAQSPADLDGRRDGTVLARRPATPAQVSDRRQTHDRHDAASAAIGGHAASETPSPATIDTPHDDQGDGRGHRTAQVSLTAILALAASP